MTLDESIPRVALGHWPTPLEPCDRLRAEIGGPRIWLKRDDCSGLAFGGNKTRKLEFLLGDAEATGASGVVTFGALQSNHCRQTAAACAVVGLPCHLILTEQVDRDTVHYTGSGNRMIDDVLGAIVHVVPDNDAALARCTELLAADAALAVIGPGGSSAVGALGYVAAAQELAAQLRKRSIHPAAIVVASSTGGTAAGLVVGLAEMRMEVPVHAAAVYADALTTRATIEHLIGATADLRGQHLTVVDDALVVDDSMLGDGYGIETPESHEAIELLARTEGVLLDPVYSAKGFAHVLTGGFDGDADVVFIHTGGQPGLFAYADAFSDGGSGVG